MIQTLEKRMFDVDKIRHKKVAFARHSSNGAKV